jgi:hypothetical protein
LPYVAGFSAIADYHSGSDGPAAVGISVVPLFSAAAVNPDVIGLPVCCCWFHYFYKRPCFCWQPY